MGEKESGVEELWVEGVCEAESNFSNRKKGEGDEEKLGRREVRIPLSLLFSPVIFSLSLHTYYE